MLESVLRGISGVRRVWFFDEIPSTQTFLENVEHLTIGDVAVARHQSEGRGRLDRTWEDVDFGSVLLSIALPQHPLLSLAVGVAVHDVLSRHTSHLSLKWPNDIVVSQDNNYRKVGGIITTLGNGEIAIAGIGINLLPPPDQERALGLADLVEASLDVSQLINALVSRVLEVSAFDRHDVISEYRQRTSTISKDVRIKVVNGKSVYGHVTNIGDDGSLLISSDNGIIGVFSGDVEYLRFGKD
ncbi:MAG: hypothetical protein RIS09_106 [Actinomycetota bacterium]|jgi:BirA family biotin operon repressor/biotin-[acetyl-CoA-carboxylase] ligase